MRPGCLALLAVQLAVLAVARGEQWHSNEASRESGESPQLKLQPRPEGHNYQQQLVHFQLAGWELGPPEAATNNRKSRTPRDAAAPQTLNDTQEWEEQEVESVRHLAAHREEPQPSSAHQDEQQAAAAAANGSASAELLAGSVSGPVLELNAVQAANLGFWRHSASASVILTAAYTIVFVVGIVGNSFVVAIVCKSPRMRTVTNYFIANLAFADILVLLFCLPATLMANLFVPYVLGLFVCKTVSYLQGVAVSASINTMVAVTMDRFLAICFPMDWHMSRRTARWTIACIWLFSLTISLPWAVYFTLVPVNYWDKNIYVCSENWPSERMGKYYFVCANLILCYLLPATVIILCYLGIWYKIERRNIPGDRPKGLKIELIMQKSKLKVVKMMMIVVVIFLLSWLPLYLIFARLKLAEERAEWEEKLIPWLMPLAQWLGASNSCINPILYTFFNRKYKRGFIDLLRFGFCCGPSTTATNQGMVVAGGGYHGAGANNVAQVAIANAMRANKHNRRGNNGLVIRMDTFENQANGGANRNNNTNNYTTSGGGGRNRTSSRRYSINNKDSSNNDFDTTTNNNGDSNSNGGGYNNSGRRLHSAATHTATTQSTEVTIDTPLPVAAQLSHEQSSVSSSAALKPPRTRSSGARLLGASSPASATRARRRRLSVDQVSTAMRMRLADFQVSRSNTLAGVQPPATCAAAAASTGGRCGSSPISGGKRTTLVCESGQTGERRPTSRLPQRVRRVPVKRLEAEGGKNGANPPESNSNRRRKPDNRATGGRRLNADLTDDKLNRTLNNESCQLSAEGPSTVEDPRRAQRRRQRRDRRQRAVSRSTGGRSSKSNSTNTTRDTVSTDMTTVSCLTNGASHELKGSGESLARANGEQPETADQATALPVATRSLRVLSSTSLSSQNYEDNDDGDEDEYAADMVDELGEADYVEDEEEYDEDEEGLYDSYSDSGQDIGLDDEQEEEEEEADGDENDNLLFGSTNDSSDERDDDDDNSNNESRHNDSSQLAREPRKSSPLTPDLLKRSLVAGGSSLVNVVIHKLSSSRSLASSQKSWCQTTRSELISIQPEVDANHHEGGSNKTTTGHSSASSRPAVEAVRGITEEALAAASCHHHHFTSENNLDNCTGGGIVDGILPRETSELVSNNLQQQHKRVSVVGINLNGCSTLISEFIDSSSPVHLEHPDQDKQPPTKRQQLKQTGVVIHSNPISQ